PSTASVVNKDFKKALLFAMSDDLNISIALAIIDELIATTNDALDKEPKNKALKKETLANMAFIAELLGFGEQEPFAYFQIGISKEEKEQIETLINKRNEAKKAKDFASSDALRAELLTLGVAIMDSPTGTVWEKV
ncbi:MAG: cysteine--tRNA ligase, partial [Epsilonproteobacteria bacterium]